MEDEKVDLIVCYWNPKRGIGTAKLPGEVYVRNDGIFFMWTDIVTEGEETIRFGTKILARLIPDPKHPQTQLKAVEIEIYADAVQS